MMVKFFTILVKYIYVQNDKRISIQRDMSSCCPKTVENKRKRENFEGIRKLNTRKLYLQRFINYPQICYVLMKSLSLLPQNSY